MNSKEQKIQESKRIMELLQPIFDKKKADFLKVFDGKFEVFEQRLQEAKNKSKQ